MAKGKWIGLLAGGFLGGPVGALAGFVLGYLFDDESAGKSSFFGGGTDGDGGKSSAFDGKTRAQQTERNGFLFSLMILAAHVIAADGKIMHSEMEYVRGFLKHTFGEDASREGDEILKKLFAQKKQIGDYNWQNQTAQCCMQMAGVMTVEQRTQLMAFLVEISKADGKVTDDEIDALRMIAVSMNLNIDIVSQLLNLGGSSLDEAYKVLGITPDVSDDEVRRAYKKMVLQHHPDRVATLGDDIKAAAEKKFKEIVEAKDRIFEARGMK